MFITGFNSSLLFIIVTNYAFIIKSTKYLSFYHCTGWGIENLDVLIIQGRVMNFRTNSQGGPRHFNPLFLKGHFIFIA